jgi:hypothetical protein
MARGSPNPRNKPGESLAKRLGIEGKATPAVEEYSIGMAIFDALRTQFTSEFASAFARFVTSHHTDRWLLFSDYVLSAPGRPNDVFAFTILPAGVYLESLTSDFQAFARRDFKDIKTVDERMLTLLSDPRAFTFSFLLDPERTVTRGAASLRGMLDRSIARLRAKRDAEARAGDISRLVLVRRKAASRGFNVKLLDNIILAAAFASFLTVCICDYRRAGRVGWFSDRDDITTAHGAFADFLFAGNVVAFSEKRFGGWSGPLLGLNGPVPPGEQLWCDAFLRVPDYFAGTLSAWDFEQGTLLDTHPKYRQVVEGAIAGRPNVRVQRLVFKHEGDRIAPFAQTIAITPKHG